MRAVDTNVLVRLLARDDEKQTREAEAWVSPGAWVSQIVLVETAWVLASVYRLKPLAIAGAVEMLLSHHNLNLQEPEIVKGALVRFRRAKGVGFSDCLVLESAARAGHLPLGTFDRALGSLGGAQRL